jgi:acyl dehydratase
MRYERRVTSEHVRALVHVFGDTNPVHRDVAAARRAGFDRPIAHGAILVGFLSEIIGVSLGMELAVFCDLKMSFERPFFEGDLLIIDVEPRHTSAALAATSYSFTVIREAERVARGDFLVKDPAAVLAPSATV